MQGGKVSHNEERPEEKVTLHEIFLGARYVCALCFVSTTPLIPFCCSPRYLIKPRKFLRARSDAGGGRVFVGILNSAVHLASDAAEEDNGD